MRKSATIQNTFAILLGIFFLIEGIWGLFSDVVFGIFTTNLSHAVIHIILGVTAIGMGAIKLARTYCFVVAFVLLIVGILRFIPGADDLVVTVFDVNMPVAYFNIVLGVLSLIVGLVGRGNDAVVKA
jgi:hypothetical protein